MPLVQIFAKPPEAGKVKTRLIPDLGADKATEVYRYCLTYTLELANKSAFDYQLWLSGKSDHAFFSGEACQIQQGDDLGARMYHALNQALLENPDDSVLLIGSDCLDLTESYLAQAVESLNTHDLVLLPTFDGGFALIGCRTINPLLFDNVIWSSEQVLRQTLDNADKLNYRVHLLETVRDIDTLSDLHHYPELRALIADH
jgi:rSAM/selenodomain-associated transferase 1